MSDYVLSDVELMTLALAQANAGEFLGNKTSWDDTRDFHCPNCGWIKGADVKQAERDEVCLYVCRQCDAIADERLPF